jgi:hypothetical protein
MGSLLRRLLWLGPALLAVTLLAFGVLSTALPSQSNSSSLPLFFNPDPGAVERLSLAALERVAEGSGGDEAARAELLALGGAALPFVLPALDSLHPAARVRVVRALRPLGVRMGFEPDANAEREVVFWSRFWEEHSIDFRPIVAERAVSRLASRSTALREAEVRQLDTYALDQLVAQMLPVVDGADAARLEKLLGDLRPLEGHAHEDEERHRHQHFVDHHAEKSGRQA